MDPLATSNDKLIPLPRLKRSATIVAGSLKRFSRATFDGDTALWARTTTGTRRAGSTIVSPDPRGSRSLRFHSVKYFGSKPRARQ